MKRAFIVAITILFLANTSIALAWNPPCMLNGDHSHETAKAATGNSLPDCHKAKKQQPQEQQPEIDHCEGLCLCAQASSSPNFTLLSSEPKPLEPTTSQSLPSSTDHPASLNLSPPERPPNSVS